MLKTLNVRRAGYAHLLQTPDIITITMIKESHVAMASVCKTVYLSKILSGSPPEDAEGGFHNVRCLIHLVLVNGSNHILALNNPSTLPSADMGF